MKPDKETLENLYLREKISPDKIAKTFSVSGRTIRNYLKEYGIERLGATHLRKGIPAIWNKGIKRSDETKEKNRQKHLGKTPVNFGVGRISLSCFVCGKEIWDKPYRKKHTCSIECKNKMMSILKGESHWNYNSENQGIQKKRLWKEYKDWRLSVFEKDNYTCQKCNQKGQKLAAHHIKSYAANPEYRLDIQNGACLCSACHKEFHKIYGLRNTDEKMFFQYITKSPLQP